MSSHSIRMAYLDRQTVRLGLWARMRAMLAARRTRQLLAEMDDRTLADIGVGRGDALMESTRPMWDIDRGVY